MPKMKTRRGAAKRFTLTSTGKLKRNRAFLGHILTKKSPTKKRNLRDSKLVKLSDTNRIKRMIGAK